MDHSKKIIFLSVLVILFIFSFFSCHSEYFNPNGLQLGKNGGHVLGTCILFTPAIIL